MPGSAQLTPAEESQPWMRTTGSPWPWTKYAIFTPSASNVSTPALSAAAPRHPARHSSAANRGTTPGMRVMGVSPRFSVHGFASPGDEASRRGEGRTEHYPGHVAPVSETATLREAVVFEGKGRRP